MKRALISDVHGNHEALQAVLADIASVGVDEINCLGDIIGYGPNPCECLDQVIKQCRVTILGNHDQAAMFDPDGFNPLALAAAYWTRDRLDRGLGVSDNPDSRWEFLGELPRTHTENGILFVHGSPREPTNEYVFPEDIYDQRKMTEFFNRIERYCFQGHTHIPGIFTESGEFIAPEDCDFEFPLGDDKVMVNVGSVGQPRDTDWRACYAIYDDEPDRRQVTFRRVEYALEETVQKIYAIPELNNSLGDRLRSGR